MNHDWQKLQEIADGLTERLKACDICPHRCGVNRLRGDIGRCGIGAQCRVASWCDHNGEEPAISGTQGSGTIFAAGCNLKCVYCQNYQISQGEIGKYDTYSAQKLADIMLELQERGCHNINLVSPTHVMPQFVSALALAVRDGLNLPVVYNSNGYDNVDVLNQLDDVVDIYLPDLKYADSAIATELSSASNYPDIAIAAIGEMYRQKGALVTDDNDIAISGVIVRHLVLPGNLSGSREILSRLADEVSPDITVSIMAQYFPTHRAIEYEQFPLHRTITADEYEEAIDAFADAGLENGWAQELSEAPENYQPDFDKEIHPFEER
jgi:putative pyruvate formate lyase activating enzyme